MTDVTTTTEVAPAPSRHRARFHPLTVASVERLTDDAVAVTFEVPDELLDEYRFEPGQHLTVRATIHGEEVRQSYSICQSRTRPAWSTCAASPWRACQRAGCRPSSTTSSRRATCST